MSESPQMIETLRQELRWLRQAIAHQPEPWLMNRLSEVEGLLARFREQQAWVTTRRILERLRSSPSR